MASRSLRHGVRSQRTQDDLVVLAVGVVVAALRAAHLVARGDHRACRPPARSVANRLRIERRRSGTMSTRGRVRADRALDAVVPGPVVVAAVAVLLAVGRVVLVLVGDQVGEREAVVRGDVVDRRARAAHQRRVAVAEQVDRARTAGSPGRGRRWPGRPCAARPGSASQNDADGVAEPVVPLGERRRELPGAPAAGADVPRLRDELEAVQRRVGRPARRGTGGRA